MILTGNASASLLTLLMTNSETVYINGFDLVLHQSLNRLPEIHMDRQSASRDSQVAP